MDDFKKAECSICGRAMDSPYCGQCGQRNTGQRVSQLTILRDVLGNLYGLDRSLLSNLILALKDPMRLVQNYWNGYRNYYLGPGRFLLIAALALVLNFLVTGESFLVVNIETEKIGLQFVFLFIALVLFTLSSYLAYFLPWKKNFAEHAVMNFYTVGLWTILFVPVSIIAGLFPETFSDDFNAGAFAVYALLILIWNARVFKINSWGHRIGRILLQGGIITGLFWGLTFL